MHNVTIQDTHVEVTLPTGIKKSISINDFKEIFNTILGESSVEETFLLPSNCYYMARTPTTLKLSCYHPEARRDIEYIPSRGGKAVKMSIPFPNIIINFSLTKNSSNGKWGVGSVKYLCTNKKLSQLPLTQVTEKEDGVWLNPMPNTYGGGNMCYGSNTMPSGFTDNFRGLDWYFQFLFSTPFNSDLSIPGAGSPTPWMKLLEASKEFPYDKLKRGF